MERYGVTNIFQLDIFRMYVCTYVIESIVIERYWGQR